MMRFFASICSWIIGVTATERGVGGQRVLLPRNNSYSIKFLHDNKITHRHWSVVIALAKFKEHRVIKVKHSHTFLVVPNFPQDHSLPFLPQFHMIQINFQRNQTITAICSPKDHEIWANYTGQQNLTFLFGPRTSIGELSSTFYAVIQICKQNVSIRQSIKNTEDTICETLDILPYFNSVQQILLCNKQLIKNILQEEVQ